MPCPDAYNSAVVQQGNKHRYPCTVCPENFSNNVLRASHMCTHNGGQKSWLCPQCPKKFPSHGEYEAHATVHATQKGKKVHACDICDFRHRSSDVFRRHMTFDHAADGAHVSHCSWCEYKNESCCAVSMHSLHAHPDQQAPRPSPSPSTGLPTPSSTPESRPPVDSPQQDRGDLLSKQEAAWAAMSEVEKKASGKDSRARQRYLKAEQRKADRRAPK